MATICSFLNNLKNYQEDSRNLYFDRKSKQKSQLLPLLFLSVLFYLNFLIFSSFSLASVDKKLPKWFSNPQQNNAKNLFGIASGVSSEEATRLALADLSSRLLVTISGETATLNEENNHSINQEFRQNLNQKIEQIEFSGFKTSNSAQSDGQFFVEVEINRPDFIEQQQRKICFMQKEVDGYQQENKQPEVKHNPLKIRKNLQKIDENLHKILLLEKIISGAGANININLTLEQILKNQQRTSDFGNNISFFLKINTLASESQNSESQRQIQNSSKAVNSLDMSQLKSAIKNKFSQAINNRGFKLNSSASADDIIVDIELDKTTTEIYNNKITKLILNIETIANKKTIATSKIEVSGASLNSEKMSIDAAIANLGKKFESEGIVKLLNLE